MNVTMKKLRNFYRCYIKPWKNSIITLILFMCIGFCVGLVISTKYTTEFYKDDRKVLLFISIVLILITYVYIYYKQYCIRNHINIEVNPTIIKYTFYTLSFFMFSIYYYFNKQTFMRSYSINKFGINQSQYILIINLIGYFTLTAIVYFIVFNDFAIKKIGKTGIEFDIEKTVIEEHNILVNQYARIIDEFSDNLCNINNLMSDLQANRLVRDDYNLEEFIILIEGFLSSFIHKNEDLSIVIIPLIQFEHFAKTELSYNSFLIKKIDVNMETNAVYAYNNTIFIKYHISLLNDSIMVIVNCTNPYPSGLGILLYSYILTLETSYSKYLGVINE